jgi:hypothetical protein
MNPLAAFNLDIAISRITWVNRTEKIKTLFESILIHTDTTRAELQNRLIKQISNNVLVREKKLFVHMSRKLLNLTFEEIAELINLSKTSVHNLFSSSLSPNDKDLLNKLEFTYSKLINC